MTRLRETLTQKGRNVSASQGLYCNRACFRPDRDCNESKGQTKQATVRQCVIFKVRYFNKYSKSCEDKYFDEIDMAGFVLEDAYMSK